MKIAKQANSKVGFNSLDGNQVTNYNTSQAHHAAGTKPTRSSRKDEASHALRQTAPHRRKQEYRHGDQVRRLPTQRVGEAAQERLEAGRGQKEGCGQPRCAIAAFEV